MRDSREIRCYTSIAKPLLLLIASAAFTAGGWWILRTSGSSIMAWVAIVFFGLCAHAPACD